MSEVTSPVRCLAADGSGRLWFCTATRLHTLRAGNATDYPLPAAANRLQPRASFVLSNDSVVLAMEDPEAPGVDHLFRFESTSGTLVRLDAGPRKLRALGTLNTGALCVQSSVADSPEASRVEQFDGRRFEQLAEAIPAPGLGKLNSVFLAQSGELWVGGDDGVAAWHEGSWRLFNPVERLAPEQGGYSIVARRVSRS